MLTYHLIDEYHTTDLHITGTFKERKTCFIAELKGNPNSFGAQNFRKRNQKVLKRCANAIRLLGPLNYPLFLSMLISFTHSKVKENVSFNVSPVFALTN